MPRSKLLCNPARAVMRFPPATLHRMSPSRLRYPARNFTSCRLLTLASSLTPLFAADNALSELVRRFTEKRGASLDPQKAAGDAMPVAVAHPFGGGRFISVGFSFENIAEAERARAFDRLLTAAKSGR